MHGLTRNRLSIALVLTIGLACSLQASAAQASPVGLVDTQLPTPTSNPLSSPTAIVPLLNTAGRSCSRRAARYACCRPTGRWSPPMR